MFFIILGTLFSSIFPSSVHPCLSTLLAMCCVPSFHFSTWKLMAGLPGFTIHLGAGCTNSWISQAPNLNVVRQLLIGTFITFLFPGTQW